jgi:hypothetical protein
MLLKKLIIATFIFSTVSSCSDNAVQDKQQVSVKQHIPQPIKQEKQQSLNSNTAEMSDKKVTLSLNDGPYVFTKENELKALWVCDGKLAQLSMNVLALPFELPNCNYAITVDRVNFTEQLLLEYKGDFAVAASSDFHGQYDLMLTLLKNNKIVDEQGHWSFNKGHFVITGDVFDRGDKVTEILWFLYRLEQEAEQAGGKLHLLLGNHEVMVLNGDLRYLHPEYVEVSKQLNQSYDQLYGKGSVLGDWLRTKPVLVKINDMLFAHGGFHPSLAKEKRSLNDINQVFKQNLIKSELDQPREGWGRYLHKSSGPIWYRGYFKDEGASSAEIDLLLNHFDIKHLVVGHTSQKQVETRHQGKVIAIDSSIKKGQYGEVLIVEGNKKWRGKLNGERVPLN